MFESVKGLLHGSKTGPKRPYSGPVISFDFGTGMSLISYCESGDPAELMKGISRQPTILLINNDTGQVTGYGDKAKDHWECTNEKESTFMPMKDGFVANEEKAIEFIKRFYKETRPSGWLKGIKGKTMKPLVVTAVPTEATKVARDVMSRVLMQGFETSHVGLIDQAIAAGIGAGADVSSPTGCAIVDIGTGTFDMTVMSSLLAILGGRLTIPTGGMAWNNAIVLKVREVHGLEIGLRSSEEIKEGIGSAIHLNGKSPEPMTVYGQRVAKEGPDHALIDSDFVFDTLDTPIGQMIAQMKGTLREVKPRQRRMLHEKGIWLTGGSAKLRNLDRRMTEDLDGIPVTLAQNPQECTVLGGALVLNDAGLFNRVVEKRSTGGWFS